MQSIILCNQQLTNFIPMAERRPISLLKICGKTILEYTLNQLEKAGCKEVKIINDDNLSMIESELTNKFNSMNIKYVNSDLTGFDSMDSAVHEEDVLLLDSNIVFNFDLNKMIMFHTVNKNYCTISSTNQADFYNYTCFSTGNDGYITSVNKKPSYDNKSAKNVFSGICILSKRLLSDYKFNFNQDFISEVLPKMLFENKKIVLFEQKGYWKKIYDSRSFLNCQCDLLEGYSGIEIEATNRQNRIFSNTNSNFNGATIIPPVLIGENVTIESGAIIGPESVIDNNVTIEKGTNISKSYISENVNISSCCEINSAIIGSNSLLQKNVKCEDNSVIGNNCIIGSNAIIRPKIKIGSDKEISANSTVIKDKNNFSAHSFFIDEEYNCCFGGSKKLPFDFSLLGMAIGTALNKSDIAVVGFSEHKASKAIADCLITGILSTGVNVFDITQCNLQEVMYSELMLGGAIGCYINSDFSIKIKIIGKGSFSLSSKIEKDIEKYYNQKSFRTEKITNWGNRYNLSGSNQLYENYLNQILPDKFNDLNIQIKTSQIETAKIADNLFYNRNDIDGKAITFHISSDGLTCTAYSEETNFITYEKLILLGIKIAIENKTKIIIPDSFPKITEVFAKNLGESLERYDRTDQKLLSLDIKLEESLFTRDGLMLVCLISQYLNQNNLSLYDSLKDIPDIYVIQRYISVKNNQKKVIKEMNDYLDKKHLNSKANIKILKNKLGFILSAESSKAEFASEICNELEEKINKLENDVNIN